MSRRETLVQLNDYLVKALDELSAKRGTSRSALIRYVLENFVAAEDERDKERRLVEGYRRCPPDIGDEWGDLEAWGEWAAGEAVRGQPWE
ncbi:MAG: CopG family transcriptional regulator [Actinomycetota bacterium]